MAGLTPMARLVNWARARSLWILPFGEYDCPGERTAALAAPGDLERWGGASLVRCPNKRIYS